MVNSLTSRRGAQRATAFTVISFGLLIGSMTVAPSSSFAKDNTTQTAERLGSPGVIDGMVLDSHGAAIINDLERTQIAPGLVHYKFERVDAKGRQPLNILKAELSDSTVKMRYLTPEKVSGSGGTVTDLTKSQDAIAGVNLDRFDINNTWAPAGWGIQNGRLIKSGNGDASASVVMTEDGLGKLVDLALEGSVKFDDGGDALPLAAVNVYGQTGADRVVLFNSQWGTYSRARYLGGPDMGVEAWIAADGTVQEVRTSVGDGQIPDGVQVLVAGKNTAAGQRIAGLQVGTKAQVAYGIRDDALKVQEAGGAWHRLIRDGQSVDYSADTSINPRTIIGFSQDGRTAYFVVADGRTPSARGLTFNEEAQLMQDLGAYNAINADGGGSSQMNVRDPGRQDATVKNWPSDGVERHDGDGMGFVLAKQGSGKVTGLEIAPVSDQTDAVRVFPGLRRTLHATAFDEMRSPATWNSTLNVSTNAEQVSIGKVERDSVQITGKKSGTVEVTAEADGAKATLDLHVLDALQRLTSSTSVVPLENRDSTSSIQIIGHDKHGFSAPIESADITVTGNESGLLDISHAPDGSFVVKALRESGSAKLSFSVQGKTVDVAVTVGVEEKLILNMDEVESDAWRVTTARSTASVQSDTGHDGGRAAKLSYDFSQSGATRTANTRPKLGHPGYSIPGQPRVIKVWVKGTSSNTAENPATYIGYSDGNDDWKYSYSTAPQGHDWQQISFSIPEGTAYPIRLQMISAYETRSWHLPIGDMWFDDPVAEVAPDVELPITELPTDDVIAADGATDQSPLRVAVISDAQFVARNPDSEQAQGARRALKEIVAAKPDVMFIDGDFVDEGSQEDFALAKTILDEELANAEFPWYYIPGNHEVMGSAIQNFTDAFGDTFRAVDYQNTRFITLNTSDAKISSDFDQLTMLRNALDTAAEDDKITGVVVLQHMPIDDPLVAKASQLSDRLDAAMEQRWLEDFREESGKSIAMINGHVGAFHAKTDDNIPYVVNGNSGKTPAVAPQGEFTGWTMLGINPDQGDWENDGKDEVDGNRGWLKAETQTRVDSLAITAPTASLTVGESADLKPQIVQDVTREVPVAWPMSWTWSGSANTHIGAAEDAPQTAIAALDPTTHHLTALRAGAGEVTLIINGKSTTVPFAVTGGDVTVSGRAQYGQRLSAAVGEWAHADGARLTWQWLRAGQEIVGATTSTYEVSTSDVGKVLSARVTAQVPGRTTVSFTSVATSAVTPVEGSAGSVTLAGTAQVGHVLTAVTTGWTPGATLTFEWLRDGVVIPSARSSAYELTAKDEGAAMSVRVTGTHLGVTTVMAISEVSAAVKAAQGPGDSPGVPAVVHSQTPRIVVPQAGLRVGQEVSVDARGWQRGATLSVQWLRDGTVITGATRAQYRLNAADRGHRISVRVTGSKPGLVSVSRTSAASSKVLVGKVSRVARIKITGKAKVGKRLSAKITRVVGGSHVSYRWLRSGKPVKGADTRHYLVRAVDRGQRITVRVTVRKAGYLTQQTSASKRVAKR